MRPVVAYFSTGGASIQRYDGTAWKGLATPTGGDTFGAGAQYFDAKFDPAGKLWMVIGGTNAVANRFNTGTQQWEAVGGPMPQIGTIGLQQPRLRFDSTGSPVIAWLANVGSGFVSASGTAVVPSKRYNLDDERRL